MDYKEINNYDFQVKNNCGELKKKILNKSIKIRVPVPRISRDALEKFSNVEEGQIQAMWSDQARNLGVRGLRQSVGYACLLTWDNISLGLVGHINSWTEECPIEVLPALEKWVKNLIKDKGVDLCSVKKGTTWLINSTRMRQDWRNKSNLAEELQRELSNWNPTWNPHSTHTRFIYNQAASGFVLNINRQSDDEYLSFIWGEDEKRIKLIPPEETFIIDFNEKTRLQKRQVPWWQIWAKKDPT